MRPAGSFEDHLAREIVASERLRMGALAALLGALLLIFPAFYGLFQDSYRQFFTSARGIVWAGLVILLLLVYELAVRRAVGQRARDGRCISEALRYLNAFVETGVPSILIVLVARHANPALVLQGAAVLIYSVFIVLSTMRLDWRLSAFTGAVAAVEYVALCWHYTGAGGAALAGTPLESPPFYLAKGAMLLLAGLAAGFVAHQLKRRAGNAFRAQQERERTLGTFGHQVSPEIVEALLKGGAGPESRRAFVCVMFMDILVRNHSGPAAAPCPARLGRGKALHVEADQLQLRRRRKEVESGALETPRRSTTGCFQAAVRRSIDRGRTGVRREARVQRLSSPGSNPEGWLCVPRIAKRRFPLVGGDYARLHAARTRRRMSRRRRGRGSEIDRMNRMLNLAPR